MEFAIVKFIAEDDAPGVVPTNWLSEEMDNCYYPLVGSDNLKSKLVAKRTDPDKENWKQFPVKVLKKFSTYSAARSRLTDAEHTSNIESESEDDVNKPRKRISKAIRLPGESSSEEESTSGRMKRQKKKSKLSSTGLSQKQLKTRLTDPLPPPPPPLMIQETEQSQSILQTSTPKNNQKPLDGQEKRCPPSTSVPCQNQLRDSKVDESFSWLSRLTSVQEAVPEIQQESEIQRLKENQTAIWSVLGEISSLAKNNSDKLDLIIRKLDCFENKEKIGAEDVKLLNAIPVEIEEFGHLNAKINESPPFRRSLIRILMTSGGRDAKSMVANIMRKTMTDNVGEKYSLTGKQLKDGPPKLSFEKMPIYKVITETCFRTHKNIGENIVREAISDWLMQSKFRKNRREQRKNLATQEKDFDTEELLDVDNFL